MATRVLSADFASAAAFNAKRALLVVRSPGQQPGSISLGHKLVVARSTSLNSSPRMRLIRTTSGVGSVAVLLL
jgi:hypothetical protein